MARQSTSFSDDRGAFRKGLGEQNLFAPGKCVNLGLMDYTAAHRLQWQSLEQVLNGGSEVILLTEHPPVYTCGRKTAGKDRPYGTKTPVIDVERGGKLTWHGPGQIVGYPILNLQKRRLSVPQYLRRLENGLIEVLSEFGVQAGIKKEHLAGLWVGEKKICSIGIAIKRWVAYHGFALNVDCDLTGFLLARPCGLEGNQITSLAALGFSIPKKSLLEAITSKLEEEFF